MIEEETGEVVACPFCDEEGDCEHLVAVFDMSFLSLDGGALFDRIDDLAVKVGAAAVQRLRNRPGSVKKITHPNLEELFLEVEDELRHEPPDSDPDVEAGLGHLIYLCNEILADLDVEQPSSSVYEGDAPGYSSAMEIYWSARPSEVLDQLERELLEWVREGT